MKQFIISYKGEMIITAEDSEEAVELFLNEDPEEICIGIDYIDTEEIKTGNE